MAITFPSVFQSAVADDPAALAAGYLTPSRFNSGCSVAGLGTNQLLYSTGANALAQSANLSYTEATAPLLAVGSGSTTLAGVQIGHAATSGIGGMWTSATVTPDYSNCIIAGSAAATYINSPSGNSTMIFLNGGTNLMQVDTRGIVPNVNATLGLGATNFGFKNGVFGGVAFSAVPTATAGTYLYITDSTTATWGATITGGGTNKVLAWYNGSAWTVVGA